MRGKLPANFRLHRYGIDVRLVNEADAEFILGLRTNIKLSRFLHPTDNDLEKQKEWIRQYKYREREGKDYYFIYSSQNVNFGLNRIYNIEGNKCTGGSWICMPGTPPEKAIPSMILARDIMFEFLDLEEDNFDVRKGNHAVLKFHRMMSCIQTGETELDILFTATKETHLTGRNRIIKLLGINK